MNTTRTFNRLFARLQLQAKLREISDQHGEDVMLEILLAALATEFAHHDWKKAHEKNSGNHSISS